MALWEDSLHPRRIQLRMKCRALRELHAMRRPIVMELNGVEHVQLRLIGLQQKVSGRVPVLRGHHDPKFRNFPIDIGNDGVSPGHGQSPARAKVILDIDNNKCCSRHFSPDKVSTDPSNAHIILRFADLGTTLATILPVF